MEQNICDNLIAEIHALQSVPPSNINRGDDGMPKTAIFGGEKRGRISSQAWKHAIRKYFGTFFGDEWNGKRTLLFCEMVADIITEIDFSIERPLALTIAEEALGKVDFDLNAPKKGSDEKEEKEKENVSDESKDSAYESKTLFFASVAQANAVANLAVREYHVKTAVLSLLSDENGKQYETDKITAIGNAVVSKLNDILGKKDSLKALKNLFDIAGIEYKTGKKKETMPLDIPEKVIKELVAFACEQCDFSKAAYKAAMNEKPSVDMVLFGRMFAKDPDLNLDACCQVAHALTTHAVRTEYDYFTAKDDLKEGKGAAMISDIPYLSGTFYRYSSINVTELAKYDLSESVADIVQAYVEAFIKTIPSGKINSFGHSVLPEYIYIVVRNDRPLNLVNSFEKPIVSNGDGYLLRSEYALADKASKYYDSGYVDKPDFEVCFDLNGDGPALGKKMKFNEMLEALNAYLAGHINFASNN